MSRAGWWPTLRRKDMTTPAKAEVCFASFKLTTHQVNLCMFFKQSDDDALSTLAGFSMAGVEVSESTVRAAQAQLNLHPAAGAKRLVLSLEKMLTKGVDLPDCWRVRDPLPEAVYRRPEGSARKLCSYVVNRDNELRCEHHANYAVAGARGSFCELHARRTAIRKEREREAAAKARALGEQRRAATAKKKAANPPTSST